MSRPRETQQRAPSGAFGRLITSPVASALLLALLLALLTNAERFMWERTPFRLVTNVRTVIGVKYVNASPNILVVTRREGCVHVLNPNAESWDEATRVLAERPSQTATMTLWSRSRLSGILGLTRERWGLRIEQDGGSGFSEEEWREARAAVIDFTYGRGTSGRPEFSRLVQQDYERNRVVWSGHVLNAIVLVVLAGLVRSLRWVPRAVATRRQRQRERSLLSGRCPGCGYSISGLPTGVCPECGSAFSQKENDPGTEPGS